MAVSGFTRLAPQPPNRLLPCLGLALALLSGQAALAQVQVQPLAAPDLFSIGTGSSDLPQDLWKGSSGALLRAMLPRLASQPLTPAAAALARDLLSAAGNAPDGAGDDEAVAGARAEALLQLGDAAGVEAIADHTPQLAQKPDLAEAAAQAALIRGEEDKACGIGDSLVSGRTGGFWLRLRAFCQARAGQTASAQLTLELAQQQEKSPGGYDRLMSALLSGGTGVMPALDSPLDFAISKRVSTDWTSALDSASAAIAVAVARDPMAAPPARLEAAARAVRLGYATPEAYAAVTPVPVDVAGADQPGAAGEAALVALATSTNDLTLKESAVLALLKRAKDPAEFQALARLSAPAIDQVMAAHPVLRDPVLFATAAAAAGDAASAKAARALVGQGGPPADPVDLAVLDGMISAASADPDPAALEALDGILVHADGPARTRTAAALALLGGLGAPLSPHDRFDLAGADLGQSALAPGRRLALDQAADARSIGDTALYVLWSALDAGAAGPAPADRAFLVRALGRAHLGADARAYALEGLVALARP